MPWENQPNDQNINKMAEDPWGSGDEQPRRPRKKLSNIEDLGKRRQSNGGGSNGGGNRGGGNDFEDLAKNAADQASGVLKRLGGGGLVFAIVAVLGLYLGGAGVYQLSPTQGSINLLFGNSTSNGSPGLNWNWPAPIGGRIIVPLSESSFVLGGSVNVRDQNGREVEEEQLIVTGDKQLISFPILVKWRVNPEALDDYVFAYNDPEAVLRLAIETVLRDNIGQNLALAAVVQNVQTIRNEIQRELEISLTSQEAELGILITGLEAVPDQPPRVPGSVQESFNDLQNVQIEETRILEEANRERNKTLQDARGTAGQIDQEASQTTASLVASGLGEANKLRQVYNAYRTDPENTVRRLYEDARRILIDNANIDATAAELRLDQILSDTFSGGSTNE